MGPLLYLAIELEINGLTLKQKELLLFIAGNILENTFWGKWNEIGSNTNTEFQEA